MTSIHVYINSSFHTSSNCEINGGVSVFIMEVCAIHGVEMLAMYHIESKKVLLFVWFVWMPNKSNQLLSKSVERIA